ncbi:ABC transporter permease [Blautia liquoris]|uniref:ABC transporter permease n=1 Tax=Blautia liquoris TaxID=2779518 RepID=A0A7M2RIN8_9FIRM|nr:ABC transporter permease [Blautia liquoris]QOV19222.1 ABC transporter permease [Blautia liquoris]
MKAFRKNIAVYYKINFRNVFLFISSYLMPIVFYLMFSAVFVSISEENKKTIIRSMCLFAITMNSLVGLPGNVIQYSVGDINRAYIIGGIRLWHVFLSIAINNMINSIVVCTLIILTAPVFFHAALPASLGYFLCTLLACIVISTLIGIVIGMVCKSDNVAIIVSQCLFLPSIFLSGIMMDVSILPSVMRKISNIFPLTHMFVLTDRIQQVSAIYISCITVVCLVVVIHRYRKIIISQ